MKNLNLTSVLKLAITLIIFGCSQENIPKNNQGVSDLEMEHVHDKSLEMINTKMLSEIYIPDGFSGDIKIKDNGIYFSFDENYVYVILDEDGVPLAIKNEYTIYCDCETPPGQCSPAHNGVIIKCISENHDCETCLLRKVETQGGIYASLKSSGFIDYSVGVRYAKYGEELPNSFEAMLELEIVSSAISRFIKDNGLTQVDEDSFGKWVVLNVFGRALPIKIKDSENRIDSRVVVSGWTMDCICPINDECVVRYVNKYTICGGRCGLTSCGMRISTELYKSYNR